MKQIFASSQNAIVAHKMLLSLQERFVNKLNEISDIFGASEHFEEVTWMRDEGLHGGGNRFEARDIGKDGVFDTGSVNISQVHYDEMPDKGLKSATALSTIIHPKNSLVPSVHIHISLTELRDGREYWRLMADLNPSNFNEDDKNIFDVALANLSGELYEEGVRQGEKYFNIPALKRHRGISLFYLENYSSGNSSDDLVFAQAFGEGVIDSYIDIISKATASRDTYTQEEKKVQLAYHTLYLFQVLTLDRGTTSGLLVHSQNDLGIMGSLPTHIDPELLASWALLLQTPQDELVQNLLSCVNEKGEINEETKERLAQAVRDHYSKYPKALSMQASGNTLPSTVANHAKS